MDREFTLANRNFKLLKINAFKQFHLVRRIAPILGDMIPLLKSLKNMDTLSEDQRLEKIADGISPIMTAISKLSEEDADKVLLCLLSAVEIQQTTGNWAKVANDTSLMFQDLELPILLAAAGRSFAFNMASFFDVLPQVLPGQG